MVFIGGWGWRPRRRPPYPPYDPNNPGPYGPPPGYGYPPEYGYGPPRGSFGYGGGGGSCLRDMLLVEGGCCLAEALGCGPQLLLAAPALLRNPATVPTVPPTAETPTSEARTSEAPATEAPTAEAPTTYAPTATEPRGRLVRRLVAMIGRYQREISPRRPPCCRFSPTCSHYAVEALERHGLARGLVLTTRRLLRCRPGAVGGVDEVPPR